MKALFSNLCGSSRGFRGVERTARKNLCSQACVRLPVVRFKLLSCTVQAGAGHCCRSPCGGLHVATSTPEQPQTGLSARQGGTRLGEPGGVGGGKQGRAREIDAALPVLRPQPRPCWRRCDGRPAGPAQQAGLGAAGLAARQAGRGAAGLAAGAAPAPAQLLPPAHREEGLHMTRAGPAARQNRVLAGAPAPGRQAITPPCPAQARRWRRPCSPAGGRARLSLLRTVPRPSPAPQGGHGAACAAWAAREARRGRRAAALDLAGWAWPASCRQLPGAGQQP